MSDSMSRRPIRARSDNPPNYRSMGRGESVLSSGGRASTLPHKRRHVHAEVQHASVPPRSATMSFRRRMAIADVGPLRQGAPALPTLITPVPLPTRAGLFVPGTPTVYADRRPMVRPQQRRGSDSDSGEVVCCSCCDNVNVQRTFQSVVLGQLLSLCLCGTGISSELLAGRGFNAPAAQSFFNYFLLFFVYGLVLICRDGDKNLLHVLKDRGWKYFLLALIDVEANYLIIMAYQHTNLTSIQILDCSTIPVVMTLSFLFLNVRYLMIHLVGVSICLCGIGLIIFADAASGRGAEGGSDRLLGDLLCLAAAVLYGAANVTEEFLVKQYDRFEYLGLVGLFGCAISGVQFAVLERQNLVTFDWTSGSLLEYALFTGAMFAFYSMVSVVMKKSSALMFNLSVLTADFYTLVAGIVIFSYSFNVFYLMSFVVVIAGSLIFSAKKTEEKPREEGSWMSSLLCSEWLTHCCGDCPARQEFTVGWLWTL